MKHKSTMKSWDLDNLLFEMNLRVLF